MYKIPANTLFLGKRIVFVPECHSTNLLAHELSLQPATSEGSVVITDKQTAGRGQRGNTWEAEPGKNLTFSIILKPSFLPVKHQFYLNIFTGLAVHDLLANFFKMPAQIKWPNDILINDKKICGILIENQLKGTIVSSTIIGIGLNVNQSQFSVETASSLSMLLKRELPLAEVLEMLLGHLETRYLQLRAGHYERLMHDYLKNMYWRGEIHAFASADSEFEGEIIGVDEAGKLMVRTGGVLSAFDIKNIRYLR